MNQKNVFILLNENNCKKTLVKKILSKNNKREAASLTFEIECSKQL